MTEEMCEFPKDAPTDEKIQEVFQRYKTIAVVGLSKNPEKPSHFVPRYLKEAGYQIIPVNPTAQGALLEEKVYANLNQIPHKVEVVNIFRPAEEVPEIVNQALTIGAKVIWMQEGILHNEAAQRAMDSGLTVIMNRCMMKEHRKIKSQA